MELTEITHIGPPATPAPGPGHRDEIRCEECGAPVELTQRYCVNCGAHRRNVDDPAARYFSQASSRNKRRSGTAVVAGSASGSGRRNSGLLPALALAIVPVAVAIGVVVGRSSNNQDSKLISALDKRTATAPASGSTAANTSSTPSNTSSTATKHKKATSSATHKHKTTKHKASSSSGKSVAAKNGYGNAQAKSVTSNNSAAAQKNGAKVVNKLKNTKGTSYLNQLPSQVVVP